MEIIKQFCSKNKQQLQNIFFKESNEDFNNYILLINYTNFEDIKVSCVNINSIEKKILNDLEKIKKNNNDDNNKNYAISINTKISTPINIILYK